MQKSFILFQSVYGIQSYWYWHDIVQLFDVISKFLNSRFLYGFY